MARKMRPEAPALIPEVDEERFQQDMAAGNQAALIESAAEKAQLDVSEVLMQVGQMQMASSICNLTRLARINLFDKLIASGKHIGLKYHDPNGSIRVTSGAADFCDAFLGVDYKTINEDRQNLRLVGPRLYDELESRIARTEWRALRNLQKVDDSRVKDALAAPEEQRADRILVIIDQVIAERDEAVKKEKESKRETEAAREVSRRHRERADELEQWKERLARGAVPTSELFEPITDDLHKAHRGTEDCIRSLDMLVTAVGYCIETENVKPDAELRDTATGVSLVQRIGDVLDRMGRKLGAVQARYEMELSPYASGYDTQLLRTDGLLVGGRADPQAPAED